MFENIKNFFYRIVYIKSFYSRLIHPTILIFGDSNTSNKIIPENSSNIFIVEKHSGLTLHDPSFDFLLSTSYDLIKPYKLILFAGSNDVALGYSYDEIEKKIKEIKDNYGDFILISNHFSDHVPCIDIYHLTTIDGIHLNDESYEIIKNELIKLLKLYF